jgi:ribosomal 50S subunit-associated protein YjgA (DUF615 family)
MFHLVNEYSDSYLWTRVPYKGSIPFHVNTVVTNGVISISHQNKPCAEGQERKQMNNLKRLIRWLEEIQQNKEPKIPYNLHDLVKALIDTMGTEEAITRLKQLDKMTEPE